jgi:hypothetical protein
MDFIERISGVSSDGGEGSLEAALLAILLMLVALIFYVFATPADGVLPRWRSERAGNNRRLHSGEG